MPEAEVESGSYVSVGLALRSIATRVYTPPRPRLITAAGVVRFADRSEKRRETRRGPKHRADGKPSGGDERNGMHGIGNGNGGRSDRPIGSGRPQLAHAAYGDRCVSATQQSFFEQEIRGPRVAVDIPDCRRNAREVSWTAWTARS